MYCTTGTIELINSVNVRKKSSIGINNLPQNVRRTVKIALQTGKIRSDEPL